MSEKTKGTLKDPVRVMKRALKFAGKDANRPILAAVHLDKSGDVVSTDSYRLYMEWHAWDGPELNIDYATAYDIAHCKVKGNGQAVIESEGGKLTVTMGDGTVINGAVQEGAYPNYRKIAEGHETYGMARVNAKQLLPVAREHIKMGDNMRLSMRDGAFTAEGMGGDPSAKFDGCAEGETYAGIAPQYLRDALGIFNGECVVRIMNPMRPMLFTDDEDIRLLVMPVRIDAEMPKKEATRKEKDMEEIKKMKVDKAELTGALHHAAIDRAANDKDGRVKAVPCKPKERELIHKLGKAGRLTHETLGDLTSYYLDGGFVCCIERRWSKRKIHLTYPELKPMCHRADLVASRKVEEKAGVAVEVKPLTKPPVKAAKPKKQAPKPPAKPKEKEDTLEDKLKELEKQLKATRKELEDVWKENERLKAKKPSVTPEPAPEPKPAPKQAETPAEEVSLDSLKAWCEGKGMVATQKRPGCCIWVEGDSTPYADDLKGMGFRFAPKRKSWYLDPR